MNMRTLTNLNQEYDSINRNMRIWRIVITMIGLGIFAFVLTGCGGGGSHSGAGTAPVSTSANIIEGVFIDSPVEGLFYQTPTHTGITDAEGHFLCFDDEMITFMLGDIMLGQAMAGEVITLMDFLDESAVPYDITHPMITNMGRFLQSLDADGDPENGITITEEVIDEISGRMIDFHQSIMDFENDVDVTACFDVLNALSMPHNGMMWGLVSEDQAWQHMGAHMGGYMNDHMGFNSFEDGVGGRPENEEDDSNDHMMDGNVSTHM